MFRWSFPLAALALPSVALALPVYDAGVFGFANQYAGMCAPKDEYDPMWSSVSRYIDDVAYVYLSSNFADRFDDNANNPDLTQAQVRTQLLQALEVWNQQSLGPVLRYGGEIDVWLQDASRLDTDFSCTDLPSVAGAALVSAVPGGRTGASRVLEDSNGATCAGPDARYAAITYRQLTTGEFRGHAVHELGHLLGLAHSFGDTTDDTVWTTDTPSVMAYDLSSVDSDFTGTNALSFQRNLWPYDIDCVDDDFDLVGSAQQDARRRSVHYVWNSYRTSGSNDWFDGGSAPYLTARGGTTGQMISAGADDWYPLYLDASAYGITVLFGDDDPPIGSAMTGDLTLTERVRFQSTPSAAGEPSLAPLMLTPYEEDPASAWWLGYAPLPSGARTAANIDAQDPPAFEAAHGPSIGSGANTGALSECAGLWSCTPTPLRSHAPLRSAWDPVTEATLFTSTLTRDCDFSALGSVANDCGAVRIHDGFYDIDAGQLAAGATIEGQIPLPTYARPTGAPNDSYTGRSDLAAAIACAPQGDGLPSIAVPFFGDITPNCMIAWVDEGTPDGHVLVSYFTMSGFSPEFSDATVLEIGGAPLSAATHLDAGYFDGRFWLTTKGARDEAEAGQVVFASTSHDNLDNWITYEVTSSVPVDAPHWIYDPLDEDRSAALVWTER